MHCEAAIRKLAAYVLDELSPPDRAEVGAHLAACHRCRAEAEQLGAAAASLRDLPKVPASMERRERAVEAMRRGAAERLARPRWERAVRALFGRSGRWGAAALFAASVLGVAAAVFLRPPPPRSHPITLVAERARGTVELERAGWSAPAALLPGMPLAAGDTVKVREGAHAVLRVSNGGLIECAAETSLRLERPSAGSGDVLFTLNYGTLWCELRPLPGGRYVIRDPRDRRLTVLGTKFEVVCK